MKRQARVRPEVVITPEAAETAAAEVQPGPLATVRTTQALPDPAIPVQTGAAVQAVVAAQLQSGVSQGEAIDLRFC